MIGNILIDSLDEWQEHGATYDDLFNFCCCSENTINDMKRTLQKVTDYFQIWYALIILTAK